MECALGNLRPAGGWKTDHVMKSVYRHSMLEKEEQAKRKAAEKFKGTFFLTFFMTNFMTKNVKIHTFI